MLAFRFTGFGRKFRDLGLHIIYARGWCPERIKQLVKVYFCWRSLMRSYPCIEMAYGNQLEKRHKLSCRSLEHRAQVYGCILRYFDLLCLYNGAMNGF